MRSLRTVETTGNNSNCAFDVARHEYPGDHDRPVGFVRLDLSSRIAEKIRAGLDRDESGDSHLPRRRRHFSAPFAAERWQDSETDWANGRGVGLARWNVEIDFTFFRMGVGD
jgi:hypothetical protein